MKKTFVVLTMLALAGCNSNPKTLTPAEQTKILTAQDKFDKKNFTTVYSESVMTPQGNVELVGRTCDTSVGLCNNHDIYLTLVENKTAKKAGAAIALSVVATVIGGVPVVDRLGYNKSELRGTTLEPKLANPVLDYAKPAFQSWIKTSASQFAPANKPINKVIIQPNRFYLVYEKLTGEKTYQLRNSLDIGLENSPFAQNYWYHCDEESTPKSLPQWQANDYSELKLALQKSVLSCISKLSTQQQASYKALSKTKQ